MEFEVEFAHDGEDPGLDNFRMHSRCFEAWESERDVATLDFKERSTLGRFIEVRRGPTLVGTIGDGAGLYRYYEGPHNRLTPSIADPDLASLKRRIGTRYRDV